MTAKQLTDAEKRALDGLLTGKTCYAISIELDLRHDSLSRQIHRAMRKLDATTLHGVAVKWERIRASETPKEDITGVD